MQYTSIGLQDKIGGIRNRIADLERQYFSNEVLILEARIIDSKQEEEQFKLVNEGIEKRIKALVKLVEELEKALEGEESDGNTI